MRRTNVNGAQHNRLPADARSGAILAMVLASLLVASLLGLALVQTILLEHRQIQAFGRQQQSLWLAEAGVQRAALRLAKSSDYAGEKWVVPAEALGSAQPGIVVIEVAKPDGTPEAREICVEARFPDDPIRRTVYRRKLLIQP